MTLHLAPARLTALAEACAAQFGPQTPPHVIRAVIADCLRAALAEAEPGSDRLLAWIWRTIWADTPYGWQCTGCQDYADAKLDVRHVPGCILWSHSRTELAALDSFEIKQGEAL